MDFGKRQKALKCSKNRSIFPKTPSVGDILIRLKLDKFLSKLRGFCWKHGFRHNCWSIMHRNFSIFTIHTLPLLRFRTRTRQPSWSFKTAAMWTWKWSRISFVRTPPTHGITLFSWSRLWSRNSTLSWSISRCISPSTRWLPFWSSSFGVPVSFSISYWHILWFNF